LPTTARDGLRSLYRPEVGRLWRVRGTSLRLQLIVAMIWSAGLVQMNGCWRLVNAM
jgi:hypothetical protein